MRLSGDACRKGQVRSSTQVGAHALRDYAWRGACPLSTNTPLTQGRTPPTLRPLRTPEDSRRAHGVPSGWQCPALCLSQHPAARVPAVGRGGGEKKGSQSIRGWGPRISPAIPDARTYLSGRDQQGDGQRTWARCPQSLTRGSRPGEGRGLREAPWAQVTQRYPLWGGRQGECPRSCRGTHTITLQTEPDLGVRHCPMHSGTAGPGRAEPQ